MNWILYFLLSRDCCPNGTDTKGAKVVNLDGNAECCISEDLARDVIAFEHGGYIRLKSRLEGRIIPTLNDSYHLRLCVPMMSSSLLFVLPPMLPASDQNFEMCLVPESQRTVTILWPGPSFCAVFTAAMPFSSQSLYDQYR